MHWPKLKLRSMLSVQAKHGYVSRGATIYIKTATLENKAGYCSCLRAVLKVYLGSRLRRSLLGGGAGTGHVGKPTTSQKFLTMCTYLNQGSSYVSGPH